MRAGKRDWFIYISDELVRKHLSIAEAIGIVMDVYRADGVGDARLSEPSAMFMRGRDEDVSNYKVKGAWIPSRKVAGFRIIGNAISEIGDEEPWTYRYCYLVDPRTAIPLAIIDECYQSALRTGVTGAVALALLGKKDSSILGIIGAGTIAKYTVEALTHFFSLTEIRVSSKSKASQDNFAREIESALGLKAVPVGSPEVAVSGADLVVTITDADTALVSVGWLSSGATICSMGNNQELDPKILYEVDKFVVDDYGFCRDVGDIHAWITKGYLKESEILQRLHGTIGEVLTGRQLGRENQIEKVLAVVQGMASCDLALARFVYEKLKHSELVQRIAM